MSKDLIEQLKQAAAARNVKLTNQGNGHWQIHGPLLVNYYPMSKNQTAYVANTIGGHKFASPAQAVKMAFQLPKAPAGTPKAERRKSNRSRRKQVMALKGDKCNWCPTILTLDSSTLDHVIPLDRGGLDNLNNWVLACQPCNQKRGNQMPELKQARQNWPKDEPDDNLSLPPW